MKTFLGFVTGLCIGGLGFVAVVLRRMSKDENYTKGVLAMVGYDNAILIKKKG